MTEVKLVSACLFGIECRYDGEDNLDEKVMELTEENFLIPVCPEQLGGLGTPRKPMNIANGDGLEVLEGKGKVLNEDNEDVTRNMIKGAEETLKIARAYDVKEAILKARSPSCGCGKIHRRELGLTEGDGVTAALLKKNGINVITEEEL